jgi:hypothetical protein
MAYTIRTEPTGYDFDVYYVLEKDSKEIFKHKGSSLIDIYSLFGHNMELLKIIMHHGMDNLKEATDFFIEETFKALKKFNALKPHLMKEKESIE